jgi:hypothetical protein
MNATTVEHIGAAGVQESHQIQIAVHVLHVLVPCCLELCRNHAKPQCFCIRLQHIVLHLNSARLAHHGWKPRTLVNLKWLGAPLLSHVRKLL